MEGTASDEKFIKFFDMLLGRFVALSVLVLTVHDTSCPWHKHYTMVVHTLFLTLLSSYPQC